MPDPLPLEPGRRQREDRLAALRRGRQGETWASLALRIKGYRIVERNFRCPRGEIDIVARRGRWVVFVEVKARPTLRDALEAVGPQSRRRIANAAQWWMARQPDASRLFMRFDVIAILPRAWPVHCIDAFRC